MENVCTEHSRFILGIDIKDKDMSGSTRFDFHKSISNLSSKYHQYFYCCIFEYKVSNKRLLDVCDQDVCDQNVRDPDVNCKSPGNIDTFGDCFLN